MAIIKKAQTKTQTSIATVLYSDIQQSFDIHPNKLDLMIDTNEEAIKNSIRNILLTNRGERLFNPLLGSDINSILFENISPQTESTLTSFIKTAITNFEPRANLINVIVSPLPDENAYVATIVFSVINKTEPVILDVILNRVR